MIWCILKCLLYKADVGKTSSKTKLFQLYLLHSLFEFLPSETVDLMPKLDSCIKCMVNCEASAVVVTVNGI